MTVHAGIFDLDGVITDTASLHMAAWKKMFNLFLRKYTKDQNVFTLNDYLQYVDGKPREDGIVSFLNSRGLYLPKGKETDTLEDKTIAGLGNYKNNLFVKLLREEPVKVFDSTLAFLRLLKKSNIKIAVVTSSKNCKEILENIQLTKFFEAQVDGSTRHQLNLKGKPEPDMFLYAAKQLKVSPQDTFIVEDAIFGVEAGKKGNFGLVIGIDRQGTMTESLKLSGADIVISDMAEINLNKIKKWFSHESSS